MQTMKKALLLGVFCASHLMAFGELTDKELKQLKSNLEIGGVRADTQKSEDREKYERLKVNTFQDDDDPNNYDMSRFRMRLVVELTDKQKNTYLVKFTGNAPEHYDSEYQGEDYWSLYMAHGDLERPKISGYLIQYGIMDGETFVLLAEEEDNVEGMLDRVRKQATRLFPGKVYLRHHYMYDDSSAGVTESSPSNIKLIKE